MNDTPANDEYYSEEARGAAETCEAGKAKRARPVSSLLKTLLNRAVPAKTVQTMFGPVNVPAFE